MATSSSSVKAPLRMPVTCSEPIFPCLASSSESLVKPDTSANSTVPSTAVWFPAPGCDCQVATYRGR